LHRTTCSGDHPQSRYLPRHEKGGPRVHSWLRPVPDDSVHVQQACSCRARRLRRQSTLVTSWPPLPCLLQHINHRQGGLFFERFSSTSPSTWSYGRRCDGKFTALHGTPSLWSDLAIAVNRNGR